MKTSSKFFLAILMVILGSAVLSLLSSLFGISSPSIQSTKEKRNSENSYLDLIEQFEDALNNEDGKAACETMFTPEMMDKTDASFFNNFSSRIALANATLYYMTKGEPQWSFSEDYKVSLTEDAIRQTQYYYQDNLNADIQIREGFELKVDVDLGESTEYNYLDIIYIYECGWRISAKSMEFYGLGFANPFAQLP